MDAVTTVFLIMGGVGVGALLLAILLGDMFHFDFLDGLFSLPVIAGFVSAFGFGGTIGTHLMPGPSLLRVLVGSAVGLAAALPTGWLAWKLTRAAMNMSTDGTPDQGSMLGTIGVVVTSIDPARPGEVRVTIAGQPMKLRARSEEPLTSGTQVFVIAAESATTVTVEPTHPALPS